MDWQTGMSAPPIVGQECPPSQFDVARLDNNVIPINRCESIINSLNLQQPENCYFINRGY